jgi:hypothetical protein
MPVAGGRQNTRRTGRWRDCPTLFCRGTGSNQVRLTHREEAEVALVDHRALRRERGRGEEVGENAERNARVRRPRPPLANSHRAFFSCRRTPGTRFLSDPAAPHAPSRPRRTPAWLAPAASCAVSTPARLGRARGVEEKKKPSLGKAEGRRRRSRRAHPRPLPPPTLSQTSFDELRDCSTQRCCSWTRWSRARAPACVCWPPARRRSRPIGADAAKRSARSLCPWCPCAAGHDPPADVHGF